MSHHIIAMSQKGATAVESHDLVRMRVNVARSTQATRRVVSLSRTTPQRVAFSVSRRNALLGVLASPLLVSLWNRSEAAELETFYGKATPPTSYGGYGGNAEEIPKYKFDYPVNWTFQPVNKVQKGTQGIDARVFNPRNRNMGAFVIVLGRAGEDNKSFQVTDVEGTFQGFAGADYDIQDAVMSATNTAKGEREIDGQQYYDYQVDSPVAHYMATITVKEGKVYAFFVKSPDKEYEANAPVFKNILQSFRTL